MEDSRAIANQIVEEELEGGSIGGENGVSKSCDQPSSEVECTNMLHKSLSFFHLYQPPLRKPMDYHAKQTLLLAYQSLGVVYGDIGTSPLYVFSSIRLSSPGEDDLLGILSLIFWTLTLVALIKYVFIVLRADDHGEGGTFALYSFLCRHFNFRSKLTIQNTRLESDANMRYYTRGSPIKSKTKNFLESNLTAQSLLTFIVLLGTCMVIGDGALTPATSVLSALQGIQSLSSGIKSRAEAMFADLGHFNKKAIQLAFSLFVYPALILTYAGEAAYLIKHPNEISTTFYSSIPDTVYWPMFVISTLAAIVASQSMISASFSIVKQSLALGCFPRVNMIHTSSKHEGQIYSPEINYTLMVICIALVVGFKQGVEIGNAYGVVVVWVMLITTCLTTLVMIVIWDINFLLVCCFFLPFIIIEGIYMTSLLNKIPQGGWVPFAISAFFLVIMLSWTYGRSKKSIYEAERKMSLGELNQILSSGTVYRTPGICFFCTDLVNGIPPIIRHYIQHTSSVREITIIVTVRTLPIKTVLPEERLVVGKLGLEGVYRCLVQFGYKDSSNMEGDDYVASVVAKLRHHLESTEEAQKLDAAMEKGVVFVMGRTILKANKSNGWLGRFTINYLYRFFQKNCRSAVSTLEVPPGKTLQVGMLYEI
ncbi:hypothetical protein F0562_030914 [Nyssa sinensis]|uniref:Potassium transporter n=1 Tax=Nyssa sinensis TaxID=561372 RepID=A0A5J5AV71_9ASTE|nr:hypothetical protein F0562_030914 [Nyssa sinensis]